MFFITARKTDCCMEETNRDRWIMGNLVLVTCVCPPSVSHSHMAFSKCCLSGWCHNLPICLPVFQPVCWPACLSNLFSCPPVRLCVYSLFIPTFLSWRSNKERRLWLTFVGSRHFGRNLAAKVENDKHLEGNWGSSGRSWPLAEMCQYWKSCWKSYLSAWAAHRELQQLWSPNSGTSQQAHSFNIVVLKHKNVPHKASFLPLTVGQKSLFSPLDLLLLSPLPLPTSDPPLFPSSSINLSNLPLLYSPLIPLLFCVPLFPSSAPPDSPHSPPPPPRASWSVWS